MKFNQLQAGMVIHCGSLQIDEAEILEFAKRYDPQWFHTDPEYAASHSKFGGLIASGWHTCGVAMRLVADHVLAGSESFASPGLQYVKWPNPVRPGDVISVDAHVHEARVSISRPTLGILRWQWIARNQRDVIVLDLEATSMFDLASDHA